MRLLFTLFTPIFSQINFPQNPDQVNMANMPSLSLTCPEFLTETTTPLILTIQNLTSSISQEILLLNDELTMISTDVSLPNEIEFFVGNCSFTTSNSSMNSHQVQVNYTEFKNNCNPVISVNADQFSFENSVQFGIELKADEIFTPNQVFTFSKDYSFYFNASIECVYDVEQTVDASFVTNITRIFYNNDIEEESGFDVEMDIYTTANYTDLVQNCTDSSALANHAPCYTVGQEIFISSVLQYTLNPHLEKKFRSSEKGDATSSMDLNLNGFHCWVNDNPDMCSTPHYSIIEEGCGVDLMINRDPGMKFYTENGAGGNYLNFSVPVFTLQGDSNHAYLTCDFEVCSGECRPDCPWEEEEEEEENYGK